MPRRLRYTNEQARNLFNKYGYMPPEGFEFRGINRTYTVLDEVQNRNVRVNFNTFLRRIKQNKIPEVDPFLHTLHAAPSSDQPKLPTDYRVIQTIFHLNNSSKNLVI